MHGFFVVSDAARAGWGRREGRMGGLDLEVGNGLGGMKSGRQR